MYIKPKKRLGQNFLIDRNIQKKIIAACELGPYDNVLEIGAGCGELTRLITTDVAGVYALEIDPYLCQVLKCSLKGHPNVKIINKDILKFNLRRYFRKLENKINPVRNTSYPENKISNGIKVIGNIPYYITTPIIEHLLEYRDRINTIFITIQKEPAIRMTATPGSKDYGSFSCFLQYYTEPKILFLIKKTCFRPVPKVDSCFMRLEMRKEPPVKVNNEKLFFKIIRAAFNKRRKVLRNSLKSVIPQQKLGAFFNKYSINSNIRPEDLALEDFANLTNI